MKHDACTINDTHYQHDFEWQKIHAVGTEQVMSVERNVDGKWFLMPWLHNYEVKQWYFFLQSMKCSQRSNVERWNWKTARRLTVRQHPKSVIKILDKTRTQSWYYLEHYQERPKAFGKAIPDQKGSNLWVARSLISCKWAAFSRSNCMFSYILLYASL